MSREVIDYVKRVFGVRDDRFPGCQPVSIEFKHFPILKGNDYVVCEKTDGVRHFLVFTTVEGRPVSALVDRSFRVTSVPLNARKQAYEGTILDGELYEKTFLVYDAIMIEAAGAMAHFKAESQIGLPIRRPSVFQAARALRAVGLFNLDEADRAAVIRAARAALGDANEGLRPHGAIILAEVVDTESVPELARALMDPTPLVARAASRALARIGSVDRKYEGQAARALTAALEVVDENAVRPAVLRDLQALAGKNYGDDVEEWVRYAQKLP